MTFRQLIVFLLFSFLPIYNSFGYKPIDNEKLIGSWKLFKVVGENSFERYDRKEDMRETARDHFLIFSKDSVTSIEYPCYILEKGVYELDGKSLKLLFSSWSQGNVLKLTDNKLTLIREENGKKNKYIYKRAKDNNKFEWKMRKRSATWPSFNVSDVCFFGYKWVFTGENDTIPNHAPDIDFIPLDTIDLTSSSESSWTEGEICFLADHYIWTYWDGFEFHEYRIYYYNGVIIKLIPMTKRGRKDIVNKAYTYKRVFLQR